MSDDRNDIETTLITRFLAGEATPAEEQEILKWRNADPAHENKFREFQKIFASSSTFYKDRRSEAGIDVDAEWQTFMASIEQKGNQRFLQNRKPLTLWFRIAASFLVLIVAGVLIYRYGNADKRKVFQTAENTMSVELPDGSIVTLNRNSKIAHNESFGETNRGLSLTGEAFFEVVPNPTKPFTIEVRGAVVEVLGTSFSVRAYDSQDVSVVVETGVVKLSVPELKEEVRLTAGSKGSYDSQSATVSTSQNDDVNYQSWKTKRLVFTERTLAEIVETLNRTYNINIVLVTDVSDSCVMTVTFDDQSLESVLKVLESTLNLTYRRDGDTIEIVRAEC